MSAANNPAKRSTYFIKKNFQLKMMLRFIALIVIGAAVSTVLMYLFAGSELESSYYEAHLKIKSTWELLMPTIIITNAISVLVIIIATIYVVLYLSHKIAGPLYKFEKVTQSIGDGDLDVNPSLREADELKTLSESFSYLLKKWKERINMVQEAQRELDTTISKLENADFEKSKLSTNLQNVNEKLKTMLKSVTNRL